MTVNQAKTLLNYILYYLTQDGMPDKLGEQESILALMKTVPRDEWTAWYYEFEGLVSTERAN